MAQRTEAAPRVYVDTSAFIAFLDRSDEHHSRYVRLFSEAPHILTSALVIAEGHGWFLRRYDATRAVQFLSFIEELTPLTVRAFDAAALSGVGSVTRKFRDQPITLADAHGLLILRQDRIATCWSTDRHLGLTGAALVN